MSHLSARRTSYQQLRRNQRQQSSERRRERHYGVLDRHGQVLFKNIQQRGTPAATVGVSRGLPRCSAKASSLRACPSRQIRIARAADVAARVRAFAPGLAAPIAHGAHGAPSVLAPGQPESAMPTRPNRSRRVAGRAERGTRRGHAPARPAPAPGARGAAGARVRGPVWNASR